MSLAPDIVAGVARRLAEHAGLELPAWVVEARTAARIAELDIDPASYVELIATARGAGELAALVEAVRVGESSLFRHRPQIDALVAVVVPALRARGKRALRVWSAGCATGEEPYTLAAVLSRALPGVQLTIVATDVSAEALERARDATYPAGEFADVPDGWRDGFVVDGDTLHVRPDIAQLVTFEQANLLDAIPPRGCDVVWCRNVLIYFSADARRRVIERLMSSLVPGGFLFVGYSETLRDIDKLETHRHGDCVFYGKPEKETTSPGVDAYRTPPYGTQLPTRRTPTSMPIENDRERTDIGVAPPPRASKSSPPRSTPRASQPIPIEPTRVVRIALEGQPRAQEVTVLLGDRLATRGIERLVIDLDPAEMLADELAPVLRRARAAAMTSGVSIELVATKPGTKRWLSRHNLGDDA